MAGGSTDPGTCPLNGVDRLAAWALGGLVVWQGEEGGRKDDGGKGGGEDDDAKREKTEMQIASRTRRA